MCFSKFPSGDILQLPRVVIYLITNPLLDFFPSLFLSHSLSLLLVFPNIVFQANSLHSNPPGVVLKYAHNTQTLFLL